MMTRAWPYVCGWLLWAGGCAQPAAAPEAPATPVGFPVQVAQVHAQPVELLLHATGSIDAYERLPVVCRVAGVVERVAFTEGDRVKRGQVLVEIELERYVLALSGAQAALDRAEAEVAEARAQAQRRQLAVDHNPGLIAREEIDAAQTRVQTLAAQARQAAVAVRKARLDLRDAQVRAPADGVIQSRDVQTGTYVTPGTRLTGLMRRDPLLLRFAVAAGDAQRLRPHAEVRLRVLDVADDFGATLIHVAQAADPATRMVAAIAQITDSQNTALRPGAFAQVIVPLAVKDGAAVVPQTAIRASERGFIAYTLDGDIVHERRVSLGLRTAEDTVEVPAGLNVGDTVVIRGIEALSEGARVRVVQGPKLETLGVLP